MQHYFSTEVSSHGFFTSVIFAGFLASELKYASNAKLLAYETEICGLMQRKFAHIQYFSGEPTKFKSAPSPRTEPDCQKYHDILLFHIHSEKNRNQIAKNNQYCF